MKTKKAEITNFGVDFYREAMKFVQSVMHDKEYAQVLIVHECYKHADSCKEYAVALIETGFTSSLVAGYKYDEVSRYLGIEPVFKEKAQERWLAYE